MPYVRGETKFWGPFSFFGKAGAGAYQYKFHSSAATVLETHPIFNYPIFSDPSSRDSTRWAPGAAFEVGMNLGWYRGFTLTLGYAVHAVAQRTPPENQLASLPPDTRFAFPDVGQNHGLRFLGGPTLGISFRW
jgi:hypothetical protein